MKKAKLLAGIIIWSLMASTILAQSNCKVLMERIGVTYNGSCKNGLADGKGDATGVDHYSGEFKKGLPDGSGTYIWQTGEKYKGDWKKGLRDGKGEYSFYSSGRDSVLAGIWKEDKYIGKEIIAPYVIEYMNSVGRVTCTKIGTNNSYVAYKFSRAGLSGTTIDGLTMQGSSGSERIEMNFTGFENVTFPFKGKVRFLAPNALNSATLNCEVRLTINEPGAWIVTLFY